MKNSRNQAWGDPAPDTKSIKFNSFIISVSYGLEAPIAEVTIAEYAVCESPKNAALTPGRTEYSLYGMQVGNCVPDKRYIKLDSISQPTLFQYNGVDVSAHPNYGNSADYKWSRFYRPIAEVRPECLSEIPGILVSSKRINSLKEDTNGALEIFTLVCCFAVLLLSTGEIGFVAADACESNFYSIYSNIKLGIQIVSLLLLSWMLVIVRPDAIYFSRLSNRQCFDQLTNQYFDRVADTVYGKVYGFIFWGLVVSLLVMVLEFTFKYFDRWKKERAATEADDLLYRSGDVVFPDEDPLVSVESQLPEGRVSIIGESNVDYPEPPQGAADLK